MSGFWDAVGRAALDLPGTAEPRPRSIYESDAPDTAIDDVEVIDVHREAEAPASATAPVMPAAAAAPPPEAGEPGPNDRVGAPRAEIERASSLSAPPVERLAPESASPTIGAADARPARAEQPAVRVVERFELHRTETQPVVAEAATAREPDERPVVTAASIATPIPAETTESDPDPQPGDDDQAAAVPFALVAEPRADESDAALLPSPAQEPALVIEIDRIDIRIEAERAAPAPPTRRRVDAGVAPSLGEYLARRAEVPQ